MLLTIVYAVEALLLLAALLLAGVWAAAWNTGAWTEYEREWNGKRYRYRVKNGHWLVKLTPWHEFAVTIGDQIFCEGVLEDFPISHGHEFNHVVEGHEQMARDGLVPDKGAGRYLRYERDLVRLGYRAIPEEERSRAFGHLWQHLFLRNRLVVVGRSK